MAVDEEVEVDDVVGVVVTTVLDVVVDDPTTDVLTELEEVVVLVLLVDVPLVGVSCPVCSATMIAAPGSTPMMTPQIGELDAGQLKSWVFRYAIGLVSPIWR
jgi:hypothetical protein